MCQREPILGPYTARKNGQTGFEIIGPNGEVVCWTVTERMTVTVVALLNLAHETGLIG